MNIGQKATRTSVKEHAIEGVIYRTRCTRYPTYTAIIWEVVTVDGKQFKGDDLPTGQHPYMTRLVIPNDKLE